MKKILLLFLSASILGISCTKQLDVKNPNEPTPDAATNESGIISLAQGVIYVNGFKSAKYSDGVFGYFWSGAMGFHELLGDVIGAEAANSFLNQIGCPDKVTFDDGSVLLNPNNPNVWYDFLRSVNLNANQGQNFPYYEWAYMYNMISGANSILEVLPNVTFTDNADSKTATLQAWAHFWKGFAYAHIGSIYYAGLINDESGTTNGNYVTKEQIIAESNKQFDLAVTDLASATGDGYDEIMTTLIPSFCQPDGGLPTASEWVKNINTMKARNILVNKTLTSMTATDWQSILTLTNAGLGSGDSYFMGRSDANADFLSPTSGTVATRVQSSAPGGGGYKLSERWVQEFKAGDARYTQNIKQGTVWIGNSDRGNSFNTRFTLYNGGKDATSSAYVYANTDAGATALPLAGSYEENALMKAEALINTGQIDQGLALVDAVRDYFHAGLTHVSGTGLSLAQAKEELRRERRVSLAFRGLSFYDARRYGISEPGVGRSGCVVVDFTGKVSTNAKIDYGFLDYWDVPDNELAYNPPADGSAEVKNPK